ncbi:protein kinase domain-containing protein [Streptomyces sp. NBC_01264]|uniref:protein kinase domain-containing protein n=1 Tax=Streptomyces sp. NBC_01264 TaxID=2903804 RepID=UPI0022590804|nr:protein kinase [Streptomyces sp. NBC_01264]MCX4781219.1 protein kinase [Streptomyces sp. NBC_01264]
MTSQNLHIGPDAAADRYRLLRSIGRGGEAVLYLAEIELAGGSEPVVVKVLDSKTTITPDVFDRISQKWNEQAELLRFVHRPGVVGVREHFEGPPIHRPGESSTLTGRALVLVMNHVDGLDLRDWRAERTLATAAERREVMRTLEQLADVLDWLHSGKATPSGRQVIHGDLSPGNVMVDAHGQATLVDFGLSKLTADHQTAEVWFTQGYAAPEVFEGKRTPGADRYAFGAIAYFLLSGESPPSTPELLAQALVRLPQFAVLDAEQRARIASIYAADPLKRPLNLAGWMKDIRRAVVSTTSSTSQRVVQDAVPLPPAAPPVPAAAPPKPVAPPQQPSQPPAAPVVAPAVPAAPPAAPPAQPVYTPAPTEPAYTPPPTEPVYTPPPVQATVPQGYGPAPAAASPAEPAPAPPPRKKRRARVVLGALLAVLVVAGGAVAGVKLLGDKKDADGSNTAASGDKAASSPANPAPTPTPTPTPTPSASESESVDPTAQPTATGTQPPSGVAPGVNAADLTVMSPVTDLGGFEVRPAKIDTKEYGAAFVAERRCYSDTYTEFDLNRAWKKLDFIVGIDDGSTNEKGRISFSLDGQPAAFSELVQLGKPITHTLEVSGALRLRIKVDKGCDNGTVVIAAPVLKR